MSNGRIGACGYRRDIIDYILSRGKVSKRKIIQKFHDCNDITLKMSILKTWAIFKNQECKGTYITLKNGFYTVSSEVI
jgi:hypothetical protein